MKKLDVLLLSLLVMLIIAFAIVVFGCFSNSFEESLYVIFVSIIAGAIIALPSLVVSLYSSTKEFSSDMNFLLNNALKIVTDSLGNLDKAIVKDVTAEPLYSILKIKSCELIEIYKQINKKIDNVYFLKKKVVLNIQKDIFNFGRSGLNEFEKVNNDLYMLKSHLDKYFD